MATVSFMGTTSIGCNFGFVGSSIGSLVQDASTPKNKQVYEWEKGRVQVSNCDSLSFSLLKSFAKEIYDIQLRGNKGDLDFCYKTTNNKV